MYIIKYNLNIKFVNSIECGFNRIINKNKSININFIIVIIIFIIFDIEISILTPLILTYKLNIKFNLILTSLILIFINLRIIYEIKIKSIKWN